MRITNLYVENWRNFKKFDIDLQRRVFLVGPNASGKSNLLDAIRFLHDIVSVGGGFQGSVLRRGGVKSLRCLYARKYPEIRIRVRIGDSENPDKWEYELGFNQDKQRHQLITKEIVRKDGTEIRVRPDGKDKADNERLTQTHLEQVHANKDFREIADFFESIKYLHIVPQLIREPERSIGKRDDPYGGDFLRQIADTTEKTRNARLRRISEALSVAAPQVKEMVLASDASGKPHLKGKFMHWRPTGAWQTEERFSDGTLRLVGLLWSMLNGVGPLLLEEPELSLHPEVVRYIPQMFARIQRQTGRQFWVSTHSSDLLRDEGIDRDEVFLLVPGDEATAVIPVSRYTQVIDLLDGGVSLAEAVIPPTSPKNISQLLLFGVKQCLQLQQQKSGVP